MGERAGAAAATRRAAKKSPPRPARRDAPARGGEPDSRDEPAPARYHFFGGKGGVGKTTSASAFALRLLDSARDGEQILLFSTDPAHSLSDSLGVEIGDRLAEVARRGTRRLFAREMDAAAALERFKNEHRATLAEIAERGTLLDSADIGELLDLSLPGVDEVMALFELSEFDRTGEFAHVVVDTAPSGHTSRLLRLPETFSHMVGALDLLAEKHRYIAAHFAGGRRARADEVDLFLRDLSERIGRVRAMLYDGARTRFTLVAVPEAMAVEETARYSELLRREGVPVAELIVNRVERVRGGCPFCRARAESQQPWLERLARDFAPLEQRRVPALGAEVRGLERLREFARLAWGEGDSRAASGREPRTRREREPRADLTGDAHFRIEPRRLIIFGGKGGVGKTTSAAACALAIAEGDPRTRVLVLSTDPAHSLSDSFAEPVGALRRGVAGVKNLDASEVDPAARFEELKSRYRAWADELFASLTGGSRFEVQFDREAMRELVALAPPGVDEIAALSAISDLVERGDYATIVLDTAPTGHLVRFLELPDVALSWVHAFIRLLLKYKDVVRSFAVAEELVALSKSIKRIIALLTDARACEFVGVAIPERMSLEETGRLADSLRRLRVPMRRLLVNAVVPQQAAARCEFCRARRDAQDGVLAEFRRRFARSVALFAAPQQPREVRGAARLREHFAAWRALDGASGRAEKKAAKSATKSASKGGAKRATKGGAERPPRKPVKKKTTGKASRETAGRGTTRGAARARREIGRE